MYKHVYEYKLAISLFVDFIDLFEGEEEEGVVPALLCKFHLKTRRPFSQILDAPPEFSSISTWAEIVFEVINHLHCVCLLSLFTGGLMIESSYRNPLSSWER